MASLWSVPLGDWRGKACFIIGGGPSFDPALAPRLRGRGRVIAVNAAYTVAPWADVLFFADRRWYEWNRDDLHRYRGDLILTRADLKDPSDARIRRIGRTTTTPLSRDAHQLAGYCGGGNALNLAYLYGADPIVLLGFDMRPGNWHTLHRLPPKEGQHRDRFIPSLERMAVCLAGDGVTVLNANPRSALRCFPFADIEELLVLDDLTQVEREKYLAIWERPDYRRVSPGMMECERAFVAMSMTSGETLIDFGAGTARATAWFASKGIKATAVDIAANAIEKHNVPFVEACLWDMPDTLGAADHGFCCDVMEHIPTEKVGAVLAGIATRVRKGCWFRIAIRPDRMGPKHLGRPLHLTVQGGEWWRRKVEAAFPLVDVVENTGRDVVLLARP